MELYKMVWAEPMIAVAKRFGISDVELRKICIKMDIPLPKAGYWMKIRFGKNVKQISLPLNNLVKDRIVVSPTSKDVLEVYSHISEQRLLQQKIEEQLGTFLVVLEKITKPDDLISNTKKYFSGTMSHNDRINNNMPVLNISVTQTNLERAYKFLDTFIKALRRRGHEITFKNGSPYINVKDVPIKMLLKERDKRVLNKESKYSWDTHVLVPSGLLYLRIKENYHSREFAEGKQTIEQQMSRIIAAIEMEADKEISETAKREKWHQEYEKRRQAELAIERAKQQENDKFQTLLNDATRFQQACIIRDYINAIRTNAVTNDKLTPALVEWIEWGMKKADWYDPSIEN